MYYYDTSTLFTLKSVYVIPFMALSVVECFRSIRYLKPTLRTRNLPTRSKQLTFRYYRIPRLDLAYELCFHEHRCRLYSMYSKLASFHVRTISKQLP